MANIDLVEDNFGGEVVTCCFFTTKEIGWLSPPSLRLSQYKKDSLQNPLPGTMESEAGNVRVFGTDFNMVNSDCQRQ